MADLNGQLPRTDAEHAAAPACGKAPRSETSKIIMPTRMAAIKIRGLLPPAAGDARAGPGQMLATPQPTPNVTPHSISLAVNLACYW